MKHKKIYLTLFSCILPLFVFCSIIDDVIDIDSSEIPKYSKYELGIKLDPNTVINNPYDPEEISMELEFISPSGIVYNIFGFYMIPFDRKDTEPYWEEVETDYKWRARFAPNEVGNWSYTVKFILNGVTNNTNESYNFTCVDSPNPGYLKVASNKRYLEFENGRSFFGISEDLRAFNNNAPASLSDCVSSTRECENSCYSKNTLDIDLKSMKEFRQSGGNIVRVFIEPYSYGIEWESLNDYTGRQNRASDFDKLVEEAYNSNTYIHFVLFNERQVIADECNNELSCWDNNPYNNTYNLTDNVEFFTSVGAKETFKNRLRYIHARWGYSPAILAYALINEPELVGRIKDGTYPEGLPNYWNRTEDINSWILEMGTYLKSQYPTHLMTVDYANKPYIPFKENEIFDFTNTHFYNWDKNIEYQRSYLTQLHLDKYDRPFVLSEFGLTCWVSDGGRYLEILNGIWSTAFTGAFSAATFYGSYAKHHNLCYGGDKVNLFKPLSNFMKYEIFNEPNNIFKPISNAQNYANSYSPPLGSNIPPDAYQFEKGGVAPVSSSLPFDEKHVVDGISTSNEKNIQIFALKNNDRIIGWVSNKNYFWYNVDNNREPNCPDPKSIYLNNPNTNSQNPVDIPSLIGETMTIDDLECDGTYIIHWFNTYYDYAFSLNPNGTNRIRSLTEIKNSNNGSLTIDIPKLQAIEVGELPYSPAYGFKIILAKADNDREWEHSVIVNEMEQSTDDICGDIALNTNSDYLLYKGCDNRINYNKSDSQNWDHYWLNGLFEDEKNICGSLTFYEKANVFYYKGCDNEVHYFADKEDGWEHGIRTSKDDDEDDIFGDIVVDSNTGSIYYVGRNKKISQLYYDSQIKDFRHTYLTATWDTDENACGEIEVSNTGVVFYEGCNGWIQHYWYDGEVWDHSHTTTLWDSEEKICGGDIAINKATGTVYYGGCNNEVMFYYFDEGTWKHGYRTSKDDPDDNICGDITVQASTGSIYYKGCNNFVNQLWYDGTTFQHADLTKTWLSSEHICGDIEIASNPTKIYYKSCENNEVQIYEYINKCAEFGFCNNFLMPNHFTDDTYIATGLYNFGDEVFINNTISKGDDVTVTAQESIDLGIGTSIITGSDAHFYIDNICDGVQ